MPLRRCALFSVALLAACATAPRTQERAILSGKSLATVVDKQHHQVEQDIDLAAVARIGKFAPPTVEVAPGAAGAGISEQQARLVANNAARSLCRSIGRYVPLDDTGSADGRLRLVLTSIVPTGRTVAGASSVIGFFTPGPFRLPAGLGALAGDGEIIGPDGQVAMMRWSRGANPVTNGAKVSTIGDAWQLAARFGEEFANAAVDADPERTGVQRATLDAESRKANQKICDARFGRVNAAGRGASFLLPLSPESMDAGAAPAPAPVPAPGPQAPVPR